MKIKRPIQLGQLVQPGKTLLLFGPRRVGKTTLIEDYIAGSQQKIVFYNGDNLSTQNKFCRTDIANLAPLVEGYQVLVIDEAQNIAQIGQSLKILNDQKPDLAVIATGSSSFELTGQVGEPLVGRKTTIFLYPLSLQEVLASKNDQPPTVAWEQLQEQLLIYGLYPNSVTAKNNQEREDFLLELVDSLLLKDILMYQDVKGSDVLLKLLRLLAFQIGSEVSLEEVGRNLGISKNTVARYLDLLQKAYIIFPLGGYSRNLRSEIKKMSKYYFYDIGVRNGVIDNFNDLTKRDDIGKLWENFAIIERLKTNAYAHQRKSYFFWRTWSGQEIDLLEEKNGHLDAWEFKFSPKKNAECPSEFKDNYPQSNWKMINRDNINNFTKFNPAHSPGALRRMNFQENKKNLKEFTDA